MPRTPASRVSFAALALSLAAAPQLAHAQDAAAEAESDPATAAGSGNEIIVTAQKFEQRAQDVPISITAVTGQRIRDIGVTDLDELSYYTPGLLIQEQSANNPGVVIRGITSDSGSAQEAPRITLYYNGNDISRSRGSYQAIYDMERIEVIKGPQATLFGTASAVGAISLVSARPREGLSGEVRGGFGNFNQTLVGGFLNVGSDVIAARIAGEWRTRDGYVENLNPAQERELYAQDQLGLRASLRFTPTDDLIVDLIGTFDRQRNGGTPFISARFPASPASPGGPRNAFFPANLGGNPAGAAALGDDQLGLNREVYDVSLSVDYIFDDNWTFTTVNGYRQFDSREVFDADGTAAPYLEFTEDATGWQINHEGRFTYAGSSVRASFGWNAFIEDGRQNIPFATEEGVFISCLTGAIPGIACIAPNGSAPSLGATAALTGGAITAIPYTSVFENRGQNEIYSLFADATWIVNPQLELTAGVRFLSEFRRSAFFAQVPVPRLPGLLPAPLRGALLGALPSLAVSLIPGQVDTRGQTFRAQEGFGAVLPRFNALFRVTDDLNVFATVSRGRRSPVVQVNARRVGGLPVANRFDVGEEIVWNYETGAKLASGPVSAAVGVYYQVYDNFQVSVPNLENPGTFITVSAGSAKNLGVEGELALDVTDWLNLFSNFNYIDAQIDDDPRNGNLAGSRFRLQPEWQASGGFTLNRDFGGVQVFATPTITHRSTIFFQVPSTALLSQGMVTQVNARAGVSFGEGRYEIAGFIRNATNEQFLLDAGNTGGAFGIPTFIPGEPRFFGVELTAQF